MTAKINEYWSVWACPKAGFLFEFEACFRYKKDAINYKDAEQKDYPNWLFEVRDPV